VPACRYADAAVDLYHTLLVRYNFHSLCDVILRNNNDTCDICRWVMLAVKAPCPIRFICKIKCTIQTLAIRQIADSAFCEIAYYDERCCSE